jgi:hypothetical protein
VKEFSIPDPLPIVKGVDSASLQAELNAVREQRTKLQTERDAAVSKANEVEVKRGRLQTKIEGLRAELDRGRKRLALLESEILSAEQVEQLTLVSGKYDELKRLWIYHENVVNGIRTTNASIYNLKAVSEKGATCPTCEQVIDGEKIAVLISDLQKEVVEADEKLQLLDKQIGAIGDVESARQSLQKHTVAVKQKEELEKELAKIVREGKDTKSEMEATGEKVDATLPFNDPFAIAETKINKILEQLRPVIAAEERVKEIERLTDQKKKLVAKAASLYALTKYFDKDGIKAELIGKYIGSFESKINSVLSAWGYKTALTMEPFSFETTTPRGYVGPVKELSGAEEHIFKAAFQCAVSIAAGINFVVIDEIEELGEDIRQNLYNKLYTMVQERTLEQAILIQYSLDRTLPLIKEGPDKGKPIPGTKYFYVENGTVEELK